MQANETNPFSGLPQFDEAMRRAVQMPPPLTGKKSKKTKRVSGKPKKKPKR
jgi:hypothetical protein